MELEPEESGTGPSSPPGSWSSACSHTPSVRESGDLGVASPPMVGGRQRREGDEPQSVQYVSEESDAIVVPEKRAKARVTPVEFAEERIAAKGKSTARNAFPA